LYGSATEVIEGHRARFGGIFRKCQRFRIHHGRATGMSKRSVAAVSIDCSSGSAELCRTMEYILEGARSAGAETKHYELCRAGEGDGAQEGAEKVLTPEGTQQLIEKLASADRVVLGVTGAARGAGTLVSEFVDACYESARWASLADIVAAEDLESAVKAGDDAGQMRFTVGRRPVSERHRGIIVLNPGGEVTDHGDPFCEDTFFMMEEVLRLLGVMPVGRILSTGLFDPAIEGNPILKRQALELGRRLMTDAVAVGTEY
jgi:hypothetical protein